LTTNTQPIPESWNDTLNHSKRLLLQKCTWFAWPDIKDNNAQYLQLFQDCRRKSIIIL